MAGVVGAVALTATAFAGTAHADPRGSTTVRSGAEALARETGISVAAAQKKLTREAGQTTTAADLARSLGSDRTAGSWIDASGALHVAVTDAAAAKAVTAAGARPTTVRYSTTQLGAVSGALEKAARAGKADDLQSWHVDPATNQVVVKTRSGVDESKKLLAAQKSGSVRVEQTRAVLSTTADLYGGREYSIDGQYLCSSGFSATDSSGRGVMVTAGHCAEGASSFSMDGVSLGTLRGVSFPSNDYAAINLSSSWTPRGVVDMYDGNGVAISGSTAAAVGATLCKSGRTTGWTCGQITSTGNTVNYGGGDVVSGLTAHSACVEQGDSGGANVSGSQAQGLSSGGALYDSGGSLVCGEKVGEPNESYFQPVNEALSAYGLTLVTE